MATSVGVWLDHKQAYLVTLANGQQSVREVKSGISRNHRSWPGGRMRFGSHESLSDEKPQQRRRQNQSHHFISALLEKVRGADQIVLLGPAHAKMELKAALEQDQRLRPRLRAVATTEKMTPRQLVAWVRDFFGQETRVMA